MNLVLQIIFLLYFQTYTTFGILLRLLTMIGMYGMFKKSGIKPFHAFIPYFNYYQLARCGGRDSEGRVLYISFALVSVINAVTLVADAFAPNLLETSAFVLIGLVTLVFELVSIVYMIRVASGLTEVYGITKHRLFWILLWAFLRFIPALLWGYNKKYQPQWQVEYMREEIANYGNTNVAAMEHGLTVNLKSRSVREFLNTKYLLRDIHMYIKPGSMVLLLGGSGAGKTTLLNAINGYEKADAEIILNGVNVYKQYSKMLHEVGFTPQQDLMRTNDTVYSTIMDFAKLRLPKDMEASERKRRVEEVMETFGLTPVRNSMVGKLSGGQRKRLSIAMEFVASPSLFILDEPDSGLDGVMARELMQQLRKIANQGKIVIVITHTPDRVVDLFDDVIVLAKDSNRTGRLAFYGSIEDARKFFEKDRMEEIVMSINRQEEGGEGRADFFIDKYNKEVRQNA